MSDPSITAYISLQPEQIIGPKHHRFKLISAGPSQPPGVLWAAEDITTTTPVAVSLLIFDPRQFGDESQLERLRNTLNRTKVLKSPYLLQHFGQYIYRGMLFISMPPLAGVSLAQLIKSGKLAKLTERQRIGMLTQLGKALHLIQMGRMSHGTLCPDLIWLVPGRGVQLLGTGWYNALDPETAELDYAAYQPEDHLIRGIASTSGDTYALAKLCVALFNKGKPESDSRPNDLNDTQWEQLNQVLNNRLEASIQGPLQLARELFGTVPDAEQVMMDSRLEQSAQTHHAIQPTHQSSPSPALTQNTADHMAAGSQASVNAGQGQRASAQNPVPQATQTANGSRTRIFAFDITSMFKHPTWLVIGFLAGIAVSQLFNLVIKDDAVQPALASSSTRLNTSDTNPDVSAVVTLAGIDAAPLDPYKPDNIERMAKNHLSVFQHPTPKDTRAPQMIVLPKGRFLMGDIQGVGDDNERPVRQVIVNTRFALSRYEVSFDEYDQFAKATERALPDDGGWGRGRQPVVNVSWQDAYDYTQWLSSITGQAYRLPSEAEWEYAARAGSESAYWWGDALQPAMAKCDGCASPITANQPAPLGSHPPNPWGFYDLNGNVDEWVADCYSENYMGASTDQRARTRISCNQQVMRGGSWFEIPRLIRSSARYRHPPDAKRDSWGFRVAVDLD